MSVAPDTDPTRAPLVSVIVAVHDVAAHVGAAIASLRAQTCADFEALVIDDGSRDGSGAVAAAAIGDDPRFRLIRQPNRGLSAARNAGLAVARGRWLAFLDGDDALAPGFLERLIGAAEDAGQDWAAGAIMLCYPGGLQVPHSAIHGSPDPAGMAARVLPLHDAPAVARLFPSAWNKVYRRALFDGVRFPEGLWFEDHEVFWQLAARTGSILHLPEPLYLHRRDRPGQITGADDDRAFEQFTVLDRLAPLVAGFARADMGMARLASRLVHERLQVLHEPARRALFLARAQDWFAACGLGWDTGGDDHVSRALGLVLAGETPLSRLCPKGPPAVPVPRDGEVVRVGDKDELARIAVRGRFVQVMPLGAEPLPDGTEALVEAMLRHDAALGFGALLTPAGHHDGWMDNRIAPLPPTGLPPGGGLLPLSPGAVLRLHPAPARMILRADLLPRLGRLSVPLWHPLAGGELVLRAALAAGSAVLLAQPVARLTGGVGAVCADQVRDWARALDLPQDAALPPGWRTVLALRACRPGLPPARSLRGIAARLGLGLQLRRAGLTAGPGVSPADPGTDRLLARLAGLPLSTD